MIVLNKPFFSPVFHHDHHKLPAESPSTTKLGEEAMRGYLFCKEMKYLSSANTYQEQSADGQRLISGPCGSTSPLGGRRQDLFLQGSTNILSLDFKASENCKGNVQMSREEKKNEAQGSAVSGRGVESITIWGKRMSSQLNISTS